MCETKLGYQYDDSNDGWDETRKFLALNVGVLAEKYGGKLFKTNVEGLWEDFINSLPENAKAFYTCNSCKHFIERFGGLVAIDISGNQISIWDDVAPSIFFSKFFAVAQNKVKNAKVVDVFVPEEKRLGYPKTGEWTHFYSELPQTMVHKDRLKTAYQVQAEKKQDFLMVVNALRDFSLDTATKALTLVESETMYRSDKVLGVAKWFKNLHELTLTTKNSKQKQNLIWKEVILAPQGYAHVRSSMIGTLLEDIQSGMSMRSVTARFEEKMNPNTYMRSQSAPTANAILEAEKLVAKLGIEESLERKYATLYDVQESLWQPMHKSHKPLLATDTRNGGVFGHLTPKDATNQNQNTTLDLPTQTMTWEKFLKKVLPTAKSIEALVDNPNRLMALVTAKNPHAPNILQWDNPVSWYYNGGLADGEMKKRVENAGGRYEENEIRVTLMWDGFTDLDLHCVNPRGQHIYYGRSARKDSYGGYLDLDMNGLDKSSETPVENMRWVSNAPEGRYKFYVHNYNERVNGRKGTPFKVELNVNGQSYFVEGQPLQSNDTVTVFYFDYTRGQQPQFINNSNVSVGANSQWKVDSNKFVKVNMITESPNLWGENKVYHSGQHIFFLLDGVKDESEGKGRGFLNEMLKGDLREIRKTLELFTANTPIDGIEDANAFGLGFTNNNDWNLTLKVKTESSEQLIKIDRWD